MKNDKLNTVARILLFIGGALVLLVLIKPIWKIELSAPQYPEGLEMHISANGLGGDVQIINGLNHYIGMKTLHNEDFIEFRILPYLISLFAAFFFVVALSGRRKLMYALLITFILFGVVAMVDFWQWEYNYGHNLDPNAAIIVPGMAYQPPLIGFKQLLNFGAYSVPDIGGWLFVVSGVLIVVSVIVDRRARKRSVRLDHIGPVAAVVLLLLSFSSCSAGPEPIRIGTDNCYYCKMTISDDRYGAELITTKGKIFKFDELHCLVSEIREKGVDINSVKDIYFTDFCKSHALVKSDKGFYLKSEQLKAPMGGDIAVFQSHDSLAAYKNELGGQEMSWSQILPAQ